MRISAGAALVVGIFLGAMATGPLRPATAAPPSADPPRPASASPSPCPWPPSLDAVTAAPRNHKVLLENDRVRVLDVTVAPGEREEVHAHCRPSVMYVTYLGIARDYDAQGHLIDEQKVAPPPSQFPQTFWLESTPPHSVENLDSRPIHLVRVELK